jgi:hypothetical protein
VLLVLVQELEVLVEQEVNNHLQDQFRFLQKKWQLSQGFNL